MKTTAEMDGWFGDPNDPDRWATWYQCMECGGWTLIQSDEEHHGHALPDSKCTHCESRRFNPQSATSKRTFNEERAKKKEKEIKKEIEKRKRAAR